MVEPGNGIVINAADNTEVTKNEVRGNGSYGIAMYALTDVFPPDRKLNVEPNPDRNFIHDNMLSDNGGHVSKRLDSLGAPGGDLFWSGKGVGNGWSEPTDKRFPADLPSQALTGAAGGG